MFVINHAKFPRSYIVAGQMLTFQPGQNRVPKKLFREIKNDPIIKPLLGLPTGLEIQDNVPPDLAELKKNLSHINNVLPDEGVELAQVMPFDLVSKTHAVALHGTVKMALQERLDKGA